MHLPIRVPLAGDFRQAWGAPLLVLPMQLPQDGVWLVVCDTRFEVERLAGGVRLANLLFLPSALAG
jgi:hypothetical protein